MAILLLIVTLTVTTGLGVIALLEIPVGGVVIGSFIVERKLRSRRAGAPDRRAAAPDRRAAGRRTS
jgi:hypothetical protein